MRKLNIDGQEIEVPDTYTLMQACETAGKEVPRFCFHERLSVAGNCRMCLVEVVGEPKPVASCSRLVRDLRPGMDGAPTVINTQNDRVRKARQNVMEFLLINHPLDCPICDQGGECDLQDQAVAYGMDHSRFAESKRAVEEKNLGPLIKTVMTRCIQCTRCVRFITEVAGVPELGSLYRGNDMQITSYLEKALTSELQGNVIDLCPVGALTSRPTAFSARTWEMTRTESIDVSDGLGSSIRIDSRNGSVVRVLPRENDEVNEEWISDKARFWVDGLQLQRLDRPYVRKRNKLEETTWAQALPAAASLLATDVKRVGVVCGPLATVEEQFALKLLLDGLGIHNIDGRGHLSGLEPSIGRGGYAFNPGIAGIEQADALLLIGANPRWEAAVLNARIRKTWLNTGLPIGVIGGVPESNFDLTYPYSYLGHGFSALETLASGEGAFFKKLKAAKQPLIVLGPAALQGSKAKAFISRAASLALAVGAVSESDSGDAWNGWGVLHSQAASYGALEVGFVPNAIGALDELAMLKAAKSGELDTLLLFGADEFDLGDIDDKCKIIYIGSHGDRGAHKADVILPGLAYTEKFGTFVNTEGRVQRIERANIAPGQAKDDWSIIRALAQALGKDMPFDSFDQLRGELFSSHPEFRYVGKRLDATSEGVISAARGKPVSPAMKDRETPLVSPITDFYMTSPIARASRTMAQCSALAQERNKQGTGTNG